MRRVENLGADEIPSVAVAPPVAPVADYETSEETAEETPSPEPIDIVDPPAVDPIPPEPEPEVTT
jgi:hypothetical protein